MARSHGTAVACYRGQRPATGTCEACRVGNAKRNEKAIARYKGTAKGLINDIKKRQRMRARRVG